jgi:hypothetical protein
MKFLIFLTLITGILNARAVEVTRPGDFVPLKEGSTGLLYSKTEQMVPSKDWPKKYRKKTSWGGTTLVHLRCTNDSGAPAPITIAQMDYSETEQSVFECQEGDLLAERLYHFLNANLKTCLHTGMRAANIKGIIKNVVINTKGTYGPRFKTGSKSRMSQHSTGSAMDVVDFSITLDDGKKMTLPASCTVNPPGSVRSVGFTKSCDRVGDMGAGFYDNFFQCWKDKVEEAKTDCSGGANLPYCEGLTQVCDASGAVGCTQPNHKDHMHLSLPFCPSLDRIAGT